jgi:hypothetical protein
MIKIFVLFIFFFSSLAFASGQDDAHLLSLAGGIASPSFNSSLFENPAGLVFNHETRVLGSVASETSNLNPLDLGVGLYLGNGSIGGAFNLNDNTASSGGLGYSVGLGASIDSLGVAFGAALHSGSGLGTSCDLGLLFGPKNKVHGGFTAYDVTNGISAFGGGIAADVGSGASLGVDASTTPKFKGTTFKPGLSVQASSLQLSMGYGFSVDQSNTSYLRTGVSVGAGVKLTESLHLQAYYNELEEYFAGLSVKL